jgi:hypothetical protein
MNNIEIKLTEAMLVYSPPQHDQYYRPYESYLDKQGLDSIKEATEEGTMVSSARLSKVASDIIFPSSTPQAKIQLPNGIKEGRYAFILVIEATFEHWVEKEIIRGFTDYLGVDNNNNIDPQMRFFINNIATIKEVRTPNNYSMYPNAGYQVSKPSLDSNVLAIIPEYTDAISLRPEDAVMWKQSQLMRMHSDNVNDSRSRLTSPLAKLSDRGNCIPSIYLNSIINGYRKGFSAISDLDNNRFDDEYDPSTDMYDNALIHISSGLINKSYLHNSLPKNNMRPSHEFTFDDLNRTWPRPKGFFKITKPSPKNQLFSPLLHTEHWDGATTETSVAFSLTHILPAIMSDFLLVGLCLEINNIGISRRPEICIGNYTEIVKGYNNISRLMDLQSRIELDVVHGLLLKKAVIFDINMVVNLTANSSFEISLNGGVKIPYNAPMFCDSYFSPLIGLNYNAVANISDNVEFIASELQRTTGNNWDTHTSIIAPDSFSFPENGWNDPITMKDTTVDNHNNPPISKLKF